MFCPVVYVHCVGVAVGIGGGVVSITKDVIGKGLLTLPASSCTVIVQLE